MSNFSQFNCLHSNNQTGYKLVKKWDWTASTKVSLDFWERDSMAALMLSFSTIVVKFDAETWGITVNAACTLRQRKDGPVTGSPLADLYTHLIWEWSKATCKSDLFFLHLSTHRAPLFLVPLWSPPCGAARNTPPPTHTGLFTPCQGHESATSESAIKFEVFPQEAWIRLPLLPVVLLTAISEPLT